MDLRQLRQFLAIYDELCIVRAAGTVGMSQQAMSASLARLEKTLDVTLFERERGGTLRSTEFAHVLARHARALLAGSERALQDIDARREATRGSVRIGIGQNLAGRIVPRAITRLLEASPEIVVHMHENYASQLQQMLLDGEIDLFAGAPPYTWHLEPALEQVPLFEEWDGVVCRKSHPLAGKKAVSLESLSHYPWIVPGSPAALHQAIFEPFVQHGLAPPQHVVYSDSISAGIELLCNTDHLFVASTNTLGVLFDAGLVVTVPSKDIRVRRQGIVSYRRNTPLSSAATALVDHIRQACREAIPRNSWLEGLRDQAGPL